MRPAKIKDSSVMRKSKEKLKLVSHSIKKNLFSLLVLCSIGLKEKQHSAQLAL